MDAVDGILPRASFDPIFPPSPVEDHRVRVVFLKPWLAPRTTCG